MLIIGCDYHPGFQQIAFVDTERGEFQEQRLAHREEAEKFYCDLAACGGKLRVGMEASGQARWFERLLAELSVELVIRVRICTMRCRCHSNCRTSRFSQLGTQIRGKRSSMSKRRICRASSRSVF